MAKQIIRLKPVKPHYAIGLNYRKALAKLTRMMMKDISLAVLEAYNHHEEEITNIVGDATPVDFVAEVINRKFKWWQEFFNTKATNIAQIFIGHAEKNTMMQLKDSISDAPVDVVKELTVKFDQRSQRMLLANQSLIKENVDLITSIPADTKIKIQSAVNLAMQRGRDKAYLKEQLKDLGIKQSNRVELIARDQINKATSVLNASKQSDLGIKKNEWKHSTAGKTPRQSHIRANGKIYDIEKGCYIDGEYIYPGQLINCRCYSTPILELDL
jgi:uncharacterized protein with gpF-like domain